MRCRHNDGQGRWRRCSRTARSRPALSPPFFTPNFENRYYKFHFKTKFKITPFLHWNTVAFPKAPRCNRVPNPKRSGRRQRKSWRWNSALRVDRKPEPNQWTNFLISSFPGLKNLTCSPGRTGISSPLTASYLHKILARNPSAEVDSCRNKDTTLFRDIADLENPLSAFLLLFSFAHGAPIYHTVDLTCLLS